jgi:hypothetical protein
MMHGNSNMKLDFSYHLPLFALQNESRELREETETQQTEKTYSLREKV